MRRLVASSLAVSLLAVASITSTIATANDGSVSDDEVSYAVSFRTDVGFQHDEAFVRSSFGQPERYPDFEWGLPLTASEAQALQERTRVRALEQPAVDYAYAQADFGGMWFDQQVGAKAFFRFIDPASHERDIAAMLPDGVPFEVLSAEYTWSFLSELKDQISGDFAELYAAGLRVTQIAAEGEVNRVVVSLETPDPNAEPYLQSRYGPSVTTDVSGPSEDDTCSSRTNCRDPLKGGLRIDPIGYSPWCSSAFLARKTSGTWLLVTAGHCIQLFGSGTGWTHNGIRFGTDGSDTLPPPGTVANPVSTQADLGWIVVDADEDKTPANQYYGCCSTDIKSLALTASNAFQQKGDLVCRSGATTGYRCGPIKNRGASKPNNLGHLITNVWVMDQDAKSGDSGAIYVTKKWNPAIDNYEYRAAGVHVHSSLDTCDPLLDECRAWYSTAEDFETLTGHSLCLSSSC